MPAGSIRPMTRRPGDPATRGLLDLLGPVAGLRAVDVACGHGRITRELARRGARAVGIDISASLISKARENEENEPLGLRYIHADIAAPGALGDDRFDAATVPAIPVTCIDPRRA
jgi:2-polyprenyl-3-methyl-5-hydroxy-6-metoxy-1,4-benzoquinol methylase